MAIDSYKLANGQTRYRVSVYVNGERVKQQRGFKTKKEARDFEARVRLEGAPKPYKTYDEVEKLYLASIESKYAGSTVYNTENALKNNVPQEWRRRNISAIKRDECQELANTVAARCKSGAKYVERISKVFEFAERMEFIKRSPFANVIMPKVKKAETDEKWAFWTAEQYAHFLETAKEYGNVYAYPYFLLELMSGMRRGEPLGLKWSDFDYEARKINLHNAVSVTRSGNYAVRNTKYDSDRVIIIDQETADVIEALRPMSDGEYIFPISYGSVHYWFNKIEKLAGLPHSRLHNMRDEHATVLLQNGAYIKDVQERLGHKDAKTTLNAYAKANRDKGKVLDYLPKNHYTPHSTER